jgi:hypothetical protein
MRFQQAFSFHPCGPVLSGCPHDDPAISDRDRQAGRIPRRLRLSISI